MAFRVTAVRRGGPEVLKYEPYQPEALSPGRVTVRNLAVGVAYADLMIREGLYPNFKPPIVPGYEVVGQVAALAPDVLDFKVGDYVAALTQVGGYATELTVTAADLVRVPTQIPPVNAAALVLNGLTAYQMLTRCCPAHVATIAVFGAGGGVGSLLLAIARSRGITVYGIASPLKHSMILARGAIPLVREGALSALRQLAPNGVDAVFDGGGGPNSKQAFDMVNEGGNLVMYGIQGLMKSGRRNIWQAIRHIAQAPRWSALRLLTANKGVHGYVVDAWKKAHPDFYRHDLAAVFDLAARGIIAPPVARVFDLADVQAAHTYFASSSHVGKVVMTTSKTLQ